MKERRNEGTKERTRALSKARRTNELRARGFVVRPSVRPSVHTANSTTPPTTVHYAIQPSALCTSPPQIQPPSSIAKVYNNNDNNDNNDDERRRTTTTTTNDDDVRTTYGRRIPTWHYTVQPPRHARICASACTTLGLCKPQSSNTDTFACCDLLVGWLLGGFADRLSAVCRPLAWSSAVRLRGWGRASVRSSDRRCKASRMHCGSTVAIHIHATQHSAAIACSIWHAGQPYNRVVFTARWSLVLSGVGAVRLSR